jgi:hypothetical protein
VEDKFPQVVDDRMAAIPPALKADDKIRLLSQHVRHLAFSLVSPVGTDNRRRCHLLSPEPELSHSTCLQERIEVTFT